MTGRNDLRIEQATLIVEPRGWDRLWSFRREIRVPLTAIEQVTIVPVAHEIPLGLRAPGLDACGKLAGTFWVARSRNFWNYSGRGPVLAIDLAPTEHFRHLYLSVDDAAQSRDVLDEHLAALGSAAAEA